VATVVIKETAVKRQARIAMLFSIGLVLSPAAMAGTPEAPAPAAPAAPDAGLAWLSPTIAGHGDMHPLPDAAYQPQKDQVYKVVFSLTKTPQKPEEASPALEAVVRAVNLYVSAGVPLDHLKFVAVLHGQATGAALDAAHYKEHFKVDNPNLDLIHKLRAAGVDVAVCGQAYLGQGFAMDGLNKDVTLTLSALTTITTLETQGYVLMPI
jgi:intracellular sulfur oxidation DsrE/DsrF family protein